MALAYLPRTEGISSTRLRDESQEKVRIGIVGCGRIAPRFAKESRCVSGVEVAGAYDVDYARSTSFGVEYEVDEVYRDYHRMLDNVDAVYVATPHLSHYSIVKEALEHGKHVLCETPMVLNGDEARELYEYAESRGVILMEANKTAHCPAFNHLMVMIKSGVIGEVVDVQASLSKVWGDKTLREFDPEQAGGSLFELGSYPLLPIVKLGGYFMKI